MRGLGRLLRGLQCYLLKRSITDSTATGTVHRRHGSQRQWRLHPLQMDGGAQWRPEEFTTVAGGDICRGHQRHNLLLW